MDTKSLELNVHTPEKLRSSVPETVQNGSSVNGSTNNGSMVNWKTIGNSEAQATGSLQLKTASNVAIVTYPQSTIQPLRSMLTRMISHKTLPQCISVVSALRGEGVTYNTFAMASTLANDTTYNTCVVDLNWWWPNEQSRKIRGSSEGVVGLLNGDLSLDEALIPTSFPNLTILPAGVLATDQQPIFVGGQGPRDLIEDLKDRFDCLLLDVPAILATNDAIPLASLGDACCMVVCQGTSTTALIKRALREISHVPTLGVLMNQSKVATPNWVQKWLPED